MIVRQLNILSKVEHCFLYEGRVYERLYADTKDKQRLIKKYPKYGFKHKYRFFISSDDYDYVVDAKLVRKLNAFLKSEDAFLRKNGV